MSQPSASLTASQPSAAVERTPSQSYGQILKSSALIGGSSALTIVVNIVRAKAMAVLLGPAGVGLFGLFNSISDLTRSVAGMGVNSSGVRQIAEAVGSSDRERIARTATVLRRVSLLLGLLGAAIVVVFRYQISRATFGTDAFATPVAVLSLVVLCQLISDGQAALIQGLRRISDLARISVVSGVLSAATSLLLVFLFRANGVVPALVSSAAITLAVSWWYRRKVDVDSVPMTLPQVRTEASDLLKLGSAFMASAVLTTAAAYLIRSYLGRRVGLDGAGLYQSAWVLGGLYVGFILQAMGSDFYPRLTAVARDHAESNRLVNEQAQVSLLLAGPGVLATLTFAPFVIAFFYASTFAGAVQPLRWICLGMALRVIAWPMGYIVLAQGARAIFFWTEVAAALVHVSVALLLGHWFGVVGATAGFFVLYVWHGLLIFFIVRRMTGFSWSPENRRTIVLFLTALALVFGAFVFLPLWIATVAGATAVATSGVHSMRRISGLVPFDRLPPALVGVLVRLRLVAATPASV